MLIRFFDVCSKALIFFIGISDEKSGICDGSIQHLEKFHFILCKYF